MCSLSERYGESLAERFHVVAIDIPGFGQSERQLDLLSPPAMGAFLLQLVKEWDLGPVQFVAPTSVRRPLYGQLPMIQRSCAAWRLVAGVWPSHCR